MNSQWYEERLFVNYFLKIIESIIYYLIWSTDTHIDECLINIQVQFDSLGSLFINRIKKEYGVYAVKKETCEEVWDKG